MVKVWVNGHGWVWGGKCEMRTYPNGLHFTSAKAGAKPFDEFSNELLWLRQYIEGKMQCNYDLVRVA